MVDLASRKASFVEKAPSRKTAELVDILIGFLEVVPE